MSLKEAVIAGDKNEEEENVQFWPLYVSHFLQTFGDRLWQFAIPIMFTKFYTRSIFPQALFMFATYSAVFCFMPAFGSWIDSTDRLKVITTTVWVQNLCIIVSTVVLYIMADMFEVDPDIDFKLILLFCACLLASMVGEIMGMGATLALEKDWVVVLCSNKTMLTTVNARMRRIDLFCKIIAPALFGIFFQFVGNTDDEHIRSGCILVGVWNAIGLVLEYGTIKMVYDRNPILQKTKADALRDSKNQQKIKANTYGTMVDEEKDEFEMDIDNYNKKPTPAGNGGDAGGDGGMQRKETIDRINLLKKSGKKKENNFTKLYNGWHYYLKSQMMWASVAYCMLYMSVLDGGSLVTAYLSFEGISYSLLGATRGMGAFFGIAGTLLTPFLSNKMGFSMELIGLITIWLFWVCLVPAGIEFGAHQFADKTILNESNLDDAYVILFCMVIARCGLWAFDLAENQLMQENVVPEVRAQINGVQVSVSQIFFILIAIAAMIWNHRDQFYVLVFFTLGEIFLACVVYTLWFKCECCRKEKFKDEEQYKKMGVDDQEL